MNDLDQALDALAMYASGSGRAALLPIDQAARASLDNPAAREDLERRLLMAFKPTAAVVAREYICSKLTLMGSEQCVPTLAPLLSDPALATAARTVLEAIPSSLATKALRDQLPRVAGLQKVGVIRSLGVRRDVRSALSLESLLKDQNNTVARAAAAALGEIGTLKTGKALIAFLRGAPGPMRAKAADAALVCAELLLAAGKKKDAETLYRSLASNANPVGVRNAALRGLQTLAAEPRKTGSAPYHHP